MGKKKKKEKLTLNVSSSGNAPEPQFLDPNPDDRPRESDLGK